MHNKPIRMTSHERHVPSLKSLEFDYLFNRFCGPTSKKKQSPRYWPFLSGIHWSSVNYPQKGPVVRKKLSCDDVMMITFERPDSLCKTENRKKRGWYKYCNVRSHLRTILQKIQNGLIKNLNKLIRREIINHLLSDSSQWWLMFLLTVTQNTQNILHCIVSYRIVSYNEMLCFRLLWFQVWLNVVGDSLKNDEMYNTRYRISYSRLFPSKRLQISPWWRHITSCNLKSPVIRLFG